MQRARVRKLIAIISGMGTNIADIMNGTSLAGGANELDLDGC